MESLSVAVIKLAIWFLGFWNWFVGRIWKSFKLHAAKPWECYMQSLMGHSGEKLEDQKAERNVNSIGLAPDIPEGCKDSPRS